MEYSFDQGFYHYRSHTLLHKRQTTIKPQKFLKNAAVWCREGLLEFYSCKCYIWCILLSSVLP